MPTRTFTHPLFGLLTFETYNKSKWVFGDAIKFTKGFDNRNVTVLTIPQLVKVPGSNKGKLRIYKRAHAQFKAVFEELERQDLMKHVKSCAGTFNQRLTRPTSGRVSKAVSNHAFGIAIDLNADDGSLGASVAPLAPVFEAYGFRWGRNFRSPDPMHFEVRTFIDDPKPLTRPVTVRLRGAALNVGATNFEGSVWCDQGLGLAAFEAVAVRETRSATTVYARGKQSRVTARLINRRRCLLLTELAGAAGFTTTWDNATKTAVLA